jgi:DNA-binding transcriptional regulator of glucitol operon
MPYHAYRGRVWRFVLARRWWVGHLLVALCCALFIRLGRWQWDRARSPTGDWQNLGYALQWPLFAAVLAVAWARFLWLEHHRVPEAVRTDPTANRTPPVPRRPTDLPIREDDPDDELAAYNAYLARLAEQDQR